MTFRSLLTVVTAAITLQSVHSVEDETKQTPCDRCIVSSNGSSTYVDVDCSDSQLERVPDCLSFYSNKTRRLNLAGNLLITLDNLRFYPNLEELDVSNNQLADISELRRMQNTRLKIVKLSSNFLGNISPLGVISSLTEIDLSDNCLDLMTWNFSDASLNNLIRLNLKSCCIKDKTLPKAVPVQAFRSLRYLDLSSNGGITNLSFIACNLTDLVTLSVARNPVRDLRTLFHAAKGKDRLCMLHSLKELDLHKTLVTSLAPLITSNLSKNLEYLNLGSLTISRPHLGTLFNSSIFPKLNRLILQWAKFHNTTLPPPSLHQNGRLNLTELDMSGFQLSDLTFLSHATNIQKLYLSQVTDGCTASNEDWCKKLSIGALSQLQDLQHLDLSYSYVADLMQLSNLSSLRSLDLTRTTSNGFGLLQFSKWESLELLNISQTGLSNITQRLPQSLLHLNASRNPLVKITSTASKLLSLDLSSPSLPTAGITDWQFLRLNNTKLQYLQVDGQRHFDLKFLQNLPDLISLHIRDTGYFCGIEANHMEDDIRWVQNITELDIGNTCFRNFSLLRRMRNLTFVAADMNGITNIDVASGMTILEKLLLSGNRGLRNITALKDLSSLAYLNLDSTSVGSSLHQVITTLPKLRFLSVSNTSVTAVEDVIGNCNSTNKPKQLQYLKLDHNRITQLCPSVFAGMNSLHEIDLSSCSLETIPSGVFAHLRSLKYLDLSDNEDMQTVQGNAIHSCSNLKGVWLRNNPITYFDPVNFYGTPNFRTLVAYQCAACCIAFSGGDKRKLPGSLPAGCQCEKELAGTASCHNLVSKDGLEAVMGLESALAIIGNVFVIIWRVKLLISRHTRCSYPVGWMIITLAIADLCTGLYLSTIMVADQVFDSQYALYAIDWTYSPWCKLASFLSVFSTQLSVSVLLTMATTILWCTIRAYPMGTGTRTIVVILALEITAAALVAATPLILQAADDPRALWSGICMPIAVQQELVFEFALPLMSAYTLAIMVTACMYGYIAYLAIKLHSQNTAREGGDDRNKRTVRRLALIVIVDILCYLPSFILLTIDPAVDAVISYELTAYVTLLTLPINAAANPILYTLSSELFAQWVKKKCGRHRRSEPSWQTEHTYSAGYPSGNNNNEEQAALLENVAEFMVSDSESDTDTCNTRSTIASESDEDRLKLEAVENTSGDHHDISPVPAHVDHPQRPLIDFQ